MGPRHYSRGNRNEDVREIIRRIVFQWGHDITVVETASFLTYKPQHLQAFFSRGSNFSRSTCQSPLPTYPLNPCPIRIESAQDFFHH